MLFCANYKALVVIALLSFGGCSRKPIQSSGTLPATSYQEAKPQEIEKHDVVTTPSASQTQLKAWNQRAGKPTFGLIPAFYQLPVSMPAGAVHIESAQVFGASYQSFMLSNTGPKSYVIEPVSTEQAQVFSKTMNQMLDAGVRFVEVSMADANRVLESEKRVIEKKAAWFPGRQLPSGVDLLISIQRGQGLYGPAFVGRVIQTSNGRLLALATVADAGPMSLEPLLGQLVSDALRRLADGT
ncbi:MAG: hypothetical protein WCK49_03765 [Myxococcaceae bacterium]